MDRFSGKQAAGRTPSAELLLATLCSLSHFCKFRLCLFRMVSSLVPLVSPLCVYTVWEGKVVPPCPPPSTGSFLNKRG